MLLDVRQIGERARRPSIWAIEYTPVLAKEAASPQVLVCWDRCTGLLLLNMGYRSLREVLQALIRVYTLPLLNSSSPKFSHDFGTRRNTKRSAVRSYYSAQSGWLASDRLGLAPDADRRRLYVIGAIENDHQRLQHRNLDVTYLVTGAAGFIGFHVADRLLERGENVVGIDNLNPYYSVELKRARLAELSRHRSFRFEQVDIADFEALKTTLHDTP